MSLKSSNKVETNRYELTVEVDGVTFENAVNKVYKKEVKRINIPGFRKGKAPRAIAGYWQRDGWNVLVKRAMTWDLSWNRSAGDYINLYKTVINE